MSIKSTLGKLFGGKGGGTEFDKLAQDFRSLGVKPEVVDEFERICREYPDSAALGLEALQSAASGAKKNPDLGQMGMTMFTAVIVAAMTNTVQHATGKMPNLSHLL